MSAEIETETSYVTVEAAGQTFGIPIARVREVFALGRLTHVPLALPEVAGVLNLRGRIVTAIDLRRRLGLPALALDAGAMAVGVDHDGEAFALVVDQVGDVMALADSTCEQPPVTLDSRWAAIIAGVHRLDGGLMLVLDLDSALEASSGALAA